jgi:tRNA (uracil-5-)-methyltransferase TRM9
MRLVKVIVEMYSSIAHEFNKTRYKVWPCVAAFLKSRGGGRLLEAGVGNGKNLAYAADIGFQTSGFDICPELVGLARGRCGGGTKLFVHDICEPIEEKYDIILCIAVLHHIQSEEGRRAALKNLIDALADGGQLLLTVWSYETFDAVRPRAFALGDNAVPWKSGSGEQLASRHYHIYDRNGFSELVGDAGLNYTISWEQQNWVAVLQK